MPLSSKQSFSHLLAEGRWFESNPRYQSFLSEFRSRFLIGTHSRVKHISQPGAPGVSPRLRRFCPFKIVPFYSLMLSFFAACLGNSELESKRRPKATISTLCSRTILSAYSGSVMFPTPMTGTFTVSLIPSAKGIK